MICERLIIGVIGGHYTENQRRHLTTDERSVALAIGARCELFLRHPLMEVRFVDEKF